jgi:DNA-binding response OmpR family regulator
MVAHAETQPILIIEDDQKTANLVSLYLDKEGFKSDVAHDGREGLKLAERHNPALIILDLMLPQIDGWEVCREIRRRSDVPILMLTARGDEIDRVAGLTLGADDYVVKPFSPRELVTRVKAILRRGRTGPAAAQSVMAHGDLLLNREKRKLSVAGRQVFLTPNEYALLEALMARPGKTFTRDELLERLYPKGEAHVIDRVIDVHVGKLRQKIEKDPGNPRHIITVHGIGYQFAEETADPPGDQPT